jgi:hypothetical protein
MEANEVTIWDVDTAYNHYLELKDLYLQNLVGMLDMVDAQILYEDLSRIYWRNHKV